MTLDADTRAEEMDMERDVAFTLPPTPPPPAPSPPPPGASGVPWERT